MRFRHGNQGGRLNPETQMPVRANETIRDGHWIHDPWGDPPRRCRWCDAINILVRGIWRCPFCDNHPHAKRATA